MVESWIMRRLIARQKHEGADMALTSPPILSRLYQAAGVAGGGGSSALQVVVARLGTRVAVVCVLTLVPRWLPQAPDCQRMLEVDQGVFLATGSMSGGHVIEFPNMGALCLAWGQTPYLLARVR